VTGRRPGRGRSVAVAVGIGLLAVVAVFLVVAAFQFNRVRGEIPLEVTSPSGAATAIPTPIATAPESYGPTTTPSAPPPSRTADAQILRMLDSNYGYRAVRAACGTTGAMIERTDDGGVTWTRMDLGTPGPQVIVALRIVDANQTDSVVGKAGDCSTSVSTSFTAGEFWGDFPERLVEQVYPDPVTSTNVHTGTDTIAVPCAGVVDAWAEPAGVVALCPDRVVGYTTADAEWTSIATGNVIGAAVDGSTGSGLVLLARADGCDGLQVSAFDVAASTNEQRACLEDDLVGDRATLAVTGAQGWIWSGTGILKSEDGGVTWARVG